MITQIGLVAGDIWIYLDHHDHVARLDEMVRHLNKNRDLLLMSLGWLAREGHVVLEGESPNYTVRLTSR